MEPFERFILEELGGHEIFSRYLGKDIKNLQTVYTWLDPSTQIGDFGNFLGTKTERGFSDMYSKEKKMQLEVIPEIKSKVFFNEIYQIWIIVDRVFNELFDNKEISDDMIEALL